MAYNACVYMETDGFCCLSKLVAKTAFACILEQNKKDQVETVWDTH